MREPGPAGLVGAAQAALEAALARVADRIHEVYSPLAPGGTDRALAYLRTLGTKIRGVLAGEDAGRARSWLSENALFAPLLEALVRELVLGPHEPDAAEPTLQLLGTLEALRGSSARPLATTPDAGRRDDLRSQMQGPGAFELLVEVAHDFRSPLTSILFLAEALRDGHSGPVTEVQRGQLGLVYSAAFGLASVAQDIMDLARREADLIGSEPEPFALTEVFGNVERMVRPLVEVKHLELRVVLPERWKVVGHPHALGRVMLNLTTNAIKFTDQGSVEIGVEPVPHGRVRYYVQDTGRGISEAERQVLFKPFKRRSKREEDGQYFSGSGIGLSIARRLLKAMGSDLDLESSDEKGTRFSFVLTSSGNRR